MCLPIWKGIWSNTAYFKGQIACDLKQANPIGFMQRSKRKVITIKRIITILAAITAMLCIPLAVHAYNVVDLPETMPFDEAFGIFSPDDITRATISNYADRRYVELTREEIETIYNDLKSMTLTRRIDSMPFRGTALNLTTKEGTKSYYVNCGVELGLYGSSNYICYAAEGAEDMLYLTNIETMYQDSEEKIGGDELYRSARNDFLILPEDAWAHTSVRQAAANNLLPYEFTKKYSNNITREEFCILLGNLICVIENYSSLEEYLADRGMVYYLNAFADCEGRDPSIFMLNALGIVSGRDGANFDPDGAVTREEASALLCRTAEHFMFIETWGELSYADKDYISSWARIFVEWVSEQSIMNGSDGYFLPMDNYTVLQAVATVNRLYKVVNRNLGYN